MAWSIFNVKQTRTWMGWACWLVVGWLSLASSAAFAAQSIGNCAQPQGTAQAMACPTPALLVNPPHREVGTVEAGSGNSGFVELIKEPVLVQASSIQVISHEQSWFAGMTLLTGLFFIFCVAFSLGGYFLPAIIAVARKHPNKLSIFLLNFFLGWTFVGYVVALVWSCTAINNNFSDKSN